MIVCADQLGLARKHGLFEGTASFATANPQDMRRTPPKLTRERGGIEILRCLLRSHPVPQYLPRCGKTQALIFPPCGKKLSRGPILEVTEPGDRRMQANN